MTGHSELLLLTALHPSLRTAPHLKRNRGCFCAWPVFILWPRLVPLVASCFFADNHFHCTTLFFLRAPAAVLVFHWSIGVPGRRTDPHKCRDLHAVASQRHAQLQNHRFPPSLFVWSDCISAGLRPLCYLFVSSWRCFRMAMHGPSTIRISFIAWHHSNRDAICF